MKRTVLRALVVVAGVAAVVAVIAATRPGDAPAAPPDPGTASSGVQPPPASEYWTPERMRDARPAPMPADD